MIFGHVTLLTFALVICDINGIVDDNLHSLGQDN